MEERLLKNIVIKKRYLCTNLMYSFFQYVFVISLIINMCSQYISIVGLPFMNTMIIEIMCISIVIMILLKKRINKHNFIKGIIFSIGLILYLGIYNFSSFFLRQSSDGVYKIIGEVVIISLYIFLANDSFENIMKKMANVIVVIAIISLIFWVFASQFHLIEPNTVCKSNWGRIKSINVYYGIYFETQNIVLPKIGTIIRNSAIFSEAPMCSFVLSIALLETLFLEEEPSSFRCIVLSTAILTSFSTTGIIIGIASIIGYFYYQNMRKNNISYIRLMNSYVIFPIVVVLGIIVGVKLFNLKMESVSGVSRLSDFSNGFKVWVYRPILGYGFNAETLDYGYSNSLIRILIKGGLYLLLPYILAFVYAIVTGVCMKRWNIVLFYIMFFIMFVFTAIPFQMMTFYIFLAVFDLFNKKNLLNKIYHLYDIFYINKRLDFFAICFLNPLY